jgi:hypothetical protein
MMKKIRKQFSLMGELLQTGLQGEKFAECSSWGVSLNIGVLIKQACLTYGNSLTCALVYMTYLM